MDPELARLVDSTSPKLNPLLANGLAVTHMKDVEQYLDQVFKSAAKSFPMELTYGGYQRCTPEEEFQRITRVITGPDKKPKRRWNVARSDVYLVKFFFNFKGVALPPRYLYLPFVSDGGCIYINGKRFNISPVLADRVISVGTEDIFVRILKARLTFKRFRQHFMTDGKRETVQVVYSDIYNKKADQKKSTAGAKTTLMHYLLCKYGFTETFMRFGGCLPVVGGSEVNNNVYSEAEWIICSSNQKGPRRGRYVPSTVQIAVRRADLTDTLLAMLAGFFYIVDRFPGRMLPEYVDAKNLWRTLLGFVIYPKFEGEGKLQILMDTHIAALDEYIDDFSHLKMQAIGLYADDLWQLFAIIIQKFNEWLLGKAKDVGSMYGKELSILYYVLSEFIAAINLLGFRLKKDVVKNRALTLATVEGQMEKLLKPYMIFSIRKEHGEVTTTSVSGDNKAFKLTSVLVAQSGSRVGKKKGASPIVTPTKLLHVSVAEVGSYSNLPKAAPDGRSRINQFVQVDATGLILRNPKYLEFLNAIQEKIKR